MTFISYKIFFKRKCRAKFYLDSELHYSSWCCGIHKLRQVCVWIKEVVTPEIVETSVCAKGLVTSEIVNKFKQEKTALRLFHVLNTVIKIMIVFSWKLWIVFCMKCGAFFLIYHLNIFFIKLKKNHNKFAFVSPIPKLYFAPYLMPFENLLSVWRRMTHKSLHHTKNHMAKTKTRPKNSTHTHSTLIIITPVVITPSVTPFNCVCAQPRVSHKLNRNNFIKCNNKNWIFIFSFWMILALFGSLFD